MPREFWQASLAELTAYCANRMAKRRPAQTRTDESALDKFFAGF